MTEPAILVMVCNSCQTENTIEQSKRFRKVTPCAHCNSVLFELDDLTDNYRITKNFRIYYRSLSDTLYDIQSLLMQKSEEIRKLAGVDREVPLRLWQEEISSGQVFRDDLLNILETTLSLLANENNLSDVDTRASADDFLHSGREILQQIQLANSSDAITLERLTEIKTRFRNLQEFAKMFDMYLGELSPYERKLSSS